MSANMLTAITPEYLMAGIVKAKRCEKYCKDEKIPKYILKKQRDSCWICENIDREPIFFLDWSCKCKEAS